MCKFNFKIFLEVTYGWSKTALTLVFIYFTSFPVYAKPLIPKGINETELLLKFISAAIVVVLANAAIPSIKHYFTKRSIKLSYFAYLKSNINSSTVRYGKAISYIPAVTVNIKEEPDWLTPLKDAKLGVPELLIDIHNALKKCNTNEKYIPYISYSGMPVTELNHEHPIWELKEDITEVICNYLLSQRQLEKSIISQYQEPFVLLASSDDESKRAQWINGGYSILFELSEHYVNTIRLKEYFEKI
jgi:hypothetical protein